MNAVIFPGQGAQYTGMGKDLYDHYPRARQLFSSIDSALGWNISGVCFEGNEKDLKDTYYQQLAILSASLAAYQVFQEKNIAIDYFAGLSLGECTALYPAGVVGLSDLVRLVQERAKAMQRASKESKSLMFAVIGIERGVLEKKAKNENFYLSNINSSKQIVISLHQDHADIVKNDLQKEGARIIELEVSGGFHSPFMKAAKDDFSEAVAQTDFTLARTPIVSNVTAQATVASDAMKKNIVQQLISPVLWLDCVNYMIENGVDTFYEVGPSRVLRGLMRKINPRVKVVNIEKKEDLDKLA